MKHFFSGKAGRLAVILIPLAALLAVWFFVRGKATPYHAMPSQAAAVFEWRGVAAMDRLEKEANGTTWADVLATTTFRNARRDVAAAARLLQHDAALRDAFLGKKLLLGLTLNKADSLHGLFALDAGATMDVQNLLKNNTLTQKIFPSVFHGHALYTVHLDKHERLVVTSVGEFLLFSRYSYLVEDAITQLEGASSWWADRRLLPDLDADAPFRLFFRPAAMAVQYENNMATHWQRVPELLRQNVEWLGFAWDGQNVTGLAEANGFFGSMGAWGEAAPDDIFSVLPDNTAFLASASFDNARVFFEKIKTDESADFEQFVLSWAGKTAAYLITEPFSQGMRDDQFIVLGTRDSALALEKLRDFSAQKGALRIDEYQTFEVFEFLSQSLLKPLMGSGQDFRNPSCAMIGRYVVFANTRSAIELWIDKYIVSQTLASDVDFLQWQQKISASGAGSAQIWVNAAYLPLLLKNLFDPARQSFHAADLRAFAGLGFVGAQFQPAANDRLTLSIAAQAQAAAKAKTTSILWKTPLAAVAATQPFVIETGPESDGAAIVVQDVRHELYRLDAGGTVLWRRQMEGPILGAVHGIDFWANGTTFFLLNTADRIWLLNDEGRDAAGFPLELQSPATNGVTAVDFDNTQKFNYFIACANGNLYGYDHFGRSLPGWNPQGGVGRIRHPVLHFQRGNKDYLAALNEAGKLFVFGRNGAERFPPAQFSGKDFGPPQADAASKSPRIVSANGAGTVFVCNLDGGTFNMQMGRGGGAPVHLVFAPLGGDARYEYAVLKEKNLSASGYEGASLKNLFQTQLPVPQDTVFALSRNRLGTLSRTKRQIFMLDGEGQLHPDFPLAGTTPFTVSDLFRKGGGQVLVVGEGSSVYAYKVR